MPTHLQNQVNTTYTAQDYFKNKKIPWASPILHSTRHRAGAELSFANVLRSHGRNISSILKFRKQRVFKQATWSHSKLKPLPGLDPFIFFKPFIQRSMELLVCTTDCMRSWEHILRSTLALTLREPRSWLGIKHVINYSQVLCLQHQAPDKIVP